MAQISSGPVGILPGQSMFETDSTRKGILDARESFVRMVNVIFERTAIAVERPDAVAALEAETPVPEFMIWRQQMGERHVQTIPAASEYDEKVYSIEERDSLLLDPTFLKSLTTSNRRVLVNGLANDPPQWSIWNAVAPEGGVTDEMIKLMSEDENKLSSVANGTRKSDGFEEDRAGIFSLARTYDYPAAGEEPLTRAQRNLLTQSLTSDGGLAPGSRVLMQGDSQTGGFWTVWEYAPGDAAADDDGFVLRRTQTYRTRDFWDFIDWYAEGYNVANPPVVRYPNAAARNSAENPVPNTKFVRLDDDGSGRWVWTVFADGAWNIVAREKGTIRLSEKLYDANREILFEPLALNLTPERLRRVFNREGSWELRILIDTLRDHSAFTDLEMNEVFFSMLHFVHSQQDQVSWAFKTSFLNIGGYNESLRAVPVQPVDNTQNLLDYIEEVKPYRVKTRDFIRTVAPDTDVVNLHVTDFDLPPYYEEATGKYRILSIANPVDLEIIKTQRPWKDWYENYQKTLLEPDYYEASTFNPVRHMNIKMEFDRVDHMPVIAEEFFVYSNGGPLHFDTQESVDNRLVEVFINREKVKSKYVAAIGNRVFISVTPDDEADVRIVIRQGLSFLLAADRIQRFYNPVAAEKNVRAMMGLEPKIGVLDGGQFDSDNGDYQVRIGAGYEKMNSDPFYGLADPFHAADRPEELVVLGASESIVIKMTDETSNDSFMMASALPSMDLMAPKETGDFDARPLNTIPHDVGIIGGSNPATLISVNSVDVAAIKSAAAPVIDPALLVIRKIKNGPQWTNYNEYREGAVVRQNERLYKARRDISAKQNMPVETLTHWSPYGYPTSLISISEQALVKRLLQVLAPMGATVIKQIEDTPIFVQRSDAWEFIRQENEPVATLAQDLTFDCTKVVLNVTGKITPPTYQKVSKSMKKSKDKDGLSDGTGVKRIVEAPGVIWVNGERIEFFAYEDDYYEEVFDGYDGYERQIVLREIRRGTNGTQICSEIRAVSNTDENDDFKGFDRGDGVKTKFYLRHTEGFTDASNLEVVLHTALKEKDGTVRVMDDYSGFDIFLPQVREQDYTATVVNGQIEVTFVRPPEKDAEVILAKTQAHIHRAGSSVTDGRIKFDIRPDISVGGMVYY